MLFYYLQLISSALNALVHGDEYGSEDGHFSLTYRIATLHVVYHKYRSEVLWFGQLVAFSPGIMVHLADENISHRSEMVMLQYTILPGVCKHHSVRLDPSPVCCGGSSQEFKSRATS